MKFARLNASVTIAIAFHVFLVASFVSEIVKIAHVSKKNSIIVGRAWFNSDSLSSYTSSAISSSDKQRASQLVWTIPYASHLKLLVSKAKTYKINEGNN